MVCAFKILKLHLLHRHVPCFGGGLCDLQELALAFYHVSPCD